MTERARLRVSVVVRALDEARHIGRLLDGLSAQTVRPDEVILVDSGSTDATVSIAQAAGARVVRVARGEFSFGRALNRGAEAASGDVLLIVSAHVYPVGEDYVERMLGPFVRPGVAIAYGRQVGDHRTKFSEHRIMQHWFPAESIWDQGHPFSNNANAAVLRDVWAELRYDETLTGLEDLEFAKRALERGYKVAYVADAPVVHVHEETWKVIQTRYRREAVAYSRIFRHSGMSAGKAIRLALGNIVGDWRHALEAGSFWQNASGIVRFRLAQFTGAWQGLRSNGRVSDELLERFYYPPSKRRPSRALRTRPVEHSEEGS